jgi:transcriptional/translational regulatory protein YebC/TACO1
VRHAFSKCGGNLGTSGSVGYLFEKSGQILFPTGSDEDAILEVALEAGAKDVVASDDCSVEVLTEADDFQAVKDALKAAGFEPEEAEVTMLASTSSSLELDDAGKMVRLLEMLEDLDDVQNVYSNADISEEVLAQL